MIADLEDSISKKLILDQVFDSRDKLFEPTLTRNFGGDLQRLIKRVLLFSKAHSYSNGTKFMGFLFVLFNLGRKTPSSLVNFFPPLGVGRFAMEFSFP